MKAFVQSRFTWLSVMVVIALGAALAVAALLEESAPVEYEFGRVVVCHERGTYRPRLRVGAGLVHAFAVA